MAKPVTRYVCQACGAVTLKWAGRCETCGEWNTIQEETVAAKPGPAARTASGSPVAFVGLAGSAEPPARYQPVAFAETVVQLGNRLCVGIGHGLFLLSGLRVLVLMHMHPTPVGETGGSRGKGGARGGESPGLQPAQSDGEDWGYPSPQQSGPCRREGQRPLAENIRAAERPRVKWIN